MKKLMASLTLLFSISLFAGESIGTDRSSFEYGKIKLNTQLLHSALSSRSKSYRDSFLSHSNVISAFEDLLEMTSAEYLQLWKENDSDSSIKINTKRPSDYFNDSLNRAVSDDFTQHVFSESSNVLEIAKKLRNICYLKTCEISEDFKEMLESINTKNYTYPACGESGNISDRKRDCNFHFKNGNFARVSRNIEGFAIYQDEATGKLWGRPHGLWEDHRVENKLDYASARI